MALLGFGKCFLFTFVICCLQEIVESVSHKRSGYEYYFAMTETGFRDAHYACAQKGMELVMPRDGSENAWLATVMRYATRMANKPRGTIWLAGTLKRRKYVSSYTDQPLQYTNFREHPNLWSIIPRCSSLYTQLLWDDKSSRNVAGLWSDECCTDKKYYICKKDINECEDNNGGCDHKCINTDGSFKCECNTSYIMKNNKCVIDHPCQRLSHGCQHFCVNTPSSYVCLCKPGYQLVDGKNCIDINECKNANGGCQQKCLNTPGSFKCECDPGYVMKNNTCVTDNHCLLLRHNCQHFCVSTPSSYVCLCKPGYRLVQGKKCEDVNECKTGNGGCDQTCKNTVGSFSCKCKSGYKIVNNTKCEDVNECLLQNGGCDHDCVNTIGSYSCKCRTGYKLSKGKKCRGVNECLKQNGGCDHECVITNKSYYCKCRTGYVLVNGKKCEDINECLKQNGGCDHDCVNTVGSHNCKCRPGYKQKNGKNCEDVNECLTQNGGCDHLCVNTVASFICKCKPGYKLTNGTKCEDVNECLTNNGGCKGQCINTDGSFVCKCGTGYRLVNGSECEDVDECKQRNGGCQHTCVNSVGSFACKCRPGYRLQPGGTCSDIDECATKNGGCQQNCTNLSGSHKCSCFEGFVPDGKYGCKDIDECKNSNGGCDHACRNTPGSYSCSCQTGFRLDVDKKTCIQSCKHDNGGCQHICNETNGVATCSCRHGYKITNDTKCKDINECLVKYNGFCNHECVNLPGTYECRCNKGYRMVAGVCRGTCNRDDLDPPRHGIRTCTGLSDDDVCQITCQKGYDYGGTKDRALYKCNQWTDFKWKVDLPGGGYTSLTVAKCIVDINVIMTLIANGELQTTEADKEKIKKGLIDSMIKLAICVYPCHIPMNEIHISQGPRYKRSLIKKYTFTMKLQSSVPDGYDAATVEKSLREGAEKFEARLLSGNFFIKVNGIDSYLSPAASFVISTVSLECPVNHVRTDYKCHSCSSGYRFISTSQTCQPCGRGYYQSLDGQSHCDQCPGNLTTFTIGARNVSSCLLCPEGFVQAADAADAILCFHHSRRPVTFDEADKYCRDRTAEVFVPKNRSDVISLDKTLKPLQDLWIGVNDRVTEGVFVYSDGTVLGSGHYTEWKQPAGLAKNVTRNCVKMQSSHGFTWTPDDCAIRLNTICEHRRSV